MFKTKTTSTGSQQIKVKAVQDGSGVLRPEIDPKRCGVLVFNRLAVGNIVAGTGVTTGYTIAKGKKLLITRIELCAAPAARNTIKIYDGNPATANFKGAVTCNNAIASIDCNILIDATAGAITPWVDVGTTANLNLAIYGLEWTEKSV